MTDRGREEGRTRPRFRKRPEPALAAADPEALFAELPRTQRGARPLWGHQVDHLRSYAADHQDSPDVALELPTGSGKTLVGLLISDWRRGTLGQRVVYACPTKQLARQVLTKAVDQGIPAVLMIGPYREWDQTELARYARGAATAITTYSAIFNLNPQLRDAHTLVFDDAHAAEGFVAEAWALSVYRNQAEYERLFDALDGSLDPTLVARMLGPDGPVADDGEVRLIPISVVNRHVSDIDRVLGSLTGDASYRFRMLRENLSSCLFYVSRREFYIRPMIPPTFSHAAFTEPIQRLYLSATLGDAGELERAFGRSGIERVPVPPVWDRTGSGRRFFVFPELCASTEPDDDEEPRGTDDAGLAGELLDLAEKRLILTPDDASAQRIADDLFVPAEERYTAKDPETGIQPFIDAEVGTLLAPNRYDGMDLPGDACRMMLMAGLPTASHLQDRFLESKLRASEVLQERIRTRILQGAGRCTRSPNDWSVVVVTDPDLLRFLSRAEVRKALPVELQAEIAFGFEQSEMSADDLLMLTESALDQDDIWQEDAEPELSRLRREATRTSPPMVAELSESAPLEVRAWELAWRQDWDAAAAAAVEVLENLNASDLRPYRALWAYFGSAWSALAAESGSSAAVERSAELLRIAHRAATGTTWLKEVAPLPTTDVDLEPIDRQAVENIIDLLRGPYRSVAKFERTSLGMLGKLAQRDSSEYEQGLVSLGKLLGADSCKPAGKGRADAVWMWDLMWVTLEAKSEQEAEGLLSMKYVNQANRQLDSLAGDVDATPPESSISVIVSSRSLVDPDAVPIAQPHVHLVSPRLVLDLAHDLVRAWRQLRGSAFGVNEPHSEAARILWEHRVLPTQIRERLSANPIRGR